MKAPPALNTSPAEQYPFLPATPSLRPFGINVVGHFRAELGVGAVGRLIVQSLEQAQIRFSASHYSASRSRQEHPFETVGGALTYDTNLFCVNADQLYPLVAQMGPAILQDRYNIGIWWWEVDTFPPAMAKAAELLDEIWVGSQHVGRAVRAATDKLVRLVPMPIRPIEIEPIDRQSSSLPEDFMFLVTFDFLSIFERKNPIAVVEAFKKAFQQGEGPFLLVKSINGKDHPEQLHALETAALGRQDIKIMDGYLSAEDQDRLLAACDCYVSLHRAEGYGLGMAEAASLGKPIIATAYSGNLTFLNHLNSFLVGYRTVRVPPGSGPYPESATWADPDLEEAASLMRRVYLNPEEAKSMGDRARKEVLDVHTFDRTAAFIRDRLEAIRLSRALAGQKRGVGSP